VKASQAFCSSSSEKDVFFFSATSTISSVVLLFSSSFFSLNRSESLGSDDGRLVFVLD